MHDRVEWLKPSDQIITQQISKYGGWIKPASIHLNVGYSQRHVQRRCKILAEHGVIEKHGDTTAYRLAELGERWLLGKASPEEFGEHA